MNAETSGKTAPKWLGGRFSGWVFTTDHKRVGMLWLGVGGFGLVLGGILSLIAALQTARPEADLIGLGTYASVVTMGGTLLTYGGLLPLALGLAVTVVPLQLGARGLAFPGLSTTALWLGLAGVVSLALSSFSDGDAPRSSWASTPSVALDPSRPGETVRLMGIFLLGLAALLTAVALVATFRGPRAPGLTNERLPLFAQSAGIFAMAVLVLAPLSLLGNGLLLLERKNPGTFDWYLDKSGLVDGYEWVFSQAIIAILVVPALGIAAEAVATFHRGVLAQRRLVTLALVAAGVLVAIVPSADTVASNRFSATLALLATIPLGAAAVVLLLAATAALRAGRPAVPLVFAIGSLVLMGAAAVVSLVLVIAHDDLKGTTFETARIDLVWAAVLLALLGGVVYWWPKVGGRMLAGTLSAFAGAVLAGSALLLGIGRIVGGLKDQPGHVGVTVDGASAGGMLGAIGVFGLGLGLILFGLETLRARTGRRVGNDPWQADTLEWYTTSPPPPGNFDSLPPVESPRPLADLRRTLAQRNAL